MVRGLWPGSVWSRWSVGGPAEGCRDGEARIGPLQPPQGCMPASPWSWSCCCCPGRGGAEHRGWELRRAVLSLQPRVISAVPTGVRQREEGSGGSPAAQRLPAGCRRCKGGGGGIHSPISGLCAPPEGPWCSFVQADSCWSPIRPSPDQAMQGRKPLSECERGQKTPAGKKKRKALFLWWEQQLCCSPAQQPQPLPRRCCRGERGRMGTTTCGSSGAAW